MSPIHFLGERPARRLRDQCHESQAFGAHGYFVIAGQVAFSQFCALEYFITNDMILSYYIIDIILYIHIIHYM